RRRQDEDDSRHDQELDERVAARPVKSDVRSRAQDLHDGYYCWTVIVTGVNRSPIGVPPGPVAVPLGVIVAAPGAIASKSTAARRPVPDAPVASAARTSV